MLPANYWYDVDEKLVLGAAIGMLPVNHWYDIDRKLVALKIGV